MLSRRLFLSSLLALIFISGSNRVCAQEDLEEVPSQQRRELWDFFSFVSLLAELGIGGPLSCNGPNGEQHWGPENGPKWKRCSEESMASSPAGAPASYSSVTSAETTESSVYGGQGTPSAGIFTKAAQGAQLWMLFVAGSVVSALIAVHLGQKKENREAGRHGMCGAIVRRKGAVSAFAEGVFPSRTKEVEMKSSQPEYRLDMSPQGNEDVSV